MEIVNATMNVNIERKINEKSLANFPHRQMRKERTGIRKTKRQYENPVEEFPVRYAVSKGENELTNALHKIRARIPENNCDEN